MVDDAPLQPLALAPAVVLEQPDDTDHEQRRDERDEQRRHAEEDQAAERATAVGLLWFGERRGRGLFDDGHVIVSFR